LATSILRVFPEADAFVQHAAPVVDHALAVVDALDLVGEVGQMAHLLGLRRRQDTSPGHARAFWMQIGMRVIGSWIAAIGLLISMLSLLKVTPR
jgi:hypothetical protein